jgi:probable HAF family extracellular repeat protein
MTDMDPANPYYDSYAAAINNNGQIVVVTDLAWRLVNFGYTGWRFVAYAGPTYYTQIYSNGVFTTINPGATSGMYGYSINNSGNVVGYAIFPDDTMHAILYFGGALHDLNDDVTNPGGWKIAVATRINDAGEIVCWAYNASLQQWQTAILTPN